MRSRYPVAQMMDLVTGRRVFNASWLSANLGLSIVQMLMLAQAWNISQHALVPACMMSSWTIGALLGTRVRSTPGICGSRILACTLLWLGSSSFVSWHLSLNMMPSPLVSIVALALAALILGASGSAWLSQLRSWPAIGERTALVRSLVGLTVGLVVVWLLPAWAGLLALACCLPLLMLDTLLARRRSLAAPGSIAASWVGRYWTTDRWQLQLDERALPRNWWWNFLVERSTPSRGYLPLSLLASGVAVMLGCVWGAVPTPFAAGLLATHTLEKLDWLLAGQLGILVIAACFLTFAARGVIGLPERLLPTSWHAHLHALAWLAPAGMAVGLVALGLPFLQATWWLALSLAGYTLASAIWGMLLPRLRPMLSTMVMAQRHLLQEQRAGWLDTLHLAYGRAREGRVTLLFTTGEGLLIAVLTPLMGWLIDLVGSVDRVLVIVALCILSGLLLTALASLLLSAQYCTRSQATHRASGRIARHAAYAGYSAARLSW